MSATAKSDVRRHRVVLRCTNSEWEQVEKDAAEVGISPDQLLSLVVAFATRARIMHAAALALNDIVTESDDPVPGTARWNDRHNPWGPDTTMA